MAKYFRVRKWGDYQHYKCGRRITWVKSYCEQLDPENENGQKFLALPDAVKAHVANLRLIAPKCENIFIWDAEKVGEAIGATVPVDLDLLQAEGYIEEITPELMAEIMSSRMVYQDRLASPSPSLSLSNTSDKKEREKDRLAASARQSRTLAKAAMERDINLEDFCREHGWSFPPLNQDYGPLLADIKANPAKQKQRRHHKSQPEHIGEAAGDIISGEDR